MYAIVPIESVVATLLLTIMSALIMIVPVRFAAVLAVGTSLSPLSVS